MCKILDLSGKVYGRLTVISFSHSDGRNSYWTCICQCGNDTIKRGAHLTAGGSTSCGCYRRERCIIHNESKTKEYKTWHRMIRRCYNPTDISFNAYASLGITVCERWLNSFDNFLSDMGRAPSPIYSIDRINNNGNYEPSNCRWATQIEQANNTRKNIMISHDGKTLSMSQWCRLLNISISVAHRRLKKNLPFELVFTRKRLK